jgi:hypothetical protein
MVIIDKTPGEINFAENEIKIRLKALTPYENTGKNALCKLTFGADGINGDHFALAWNNLSFEFLCKSKPNQDISTEYFSASAIDQLYYINTQRQPGEYEIFVLNLFKSNYYLTSDFNIYIENLHTFVFEAKKIGSQFNIEYTIGSGNMSFQNTVLGEDRILKDGFKIFLRSYLNNELLAEDRLSIDDDQISEFDLNGLFNFDLYPVFPIVSRFAIGEYFKNISVDFGEYYDGTVQRIYYSGNQIHIAPGGLAKEILAHMKLINIDSKSYILSRSNFMSWSPKRFSVGYFQPNFFKYLVLTLDPIITLKTQLVFSDSSVTLSDNLTVNQFDAVDIALSAFDLQLAYSQKIKSIIIWIENQNGLILTQKKQMDIDHSKRRNEHYFIFQNSLGCFESIRTIGEFAEKTKLSRNEYSVTQSIESKLKHEIKQDIEISRELRFNTGALINHSNDALTFQRYFNDFFISKKIFLVAGNKLIPFTINTNDYTPFNSLNLNESIEFEGVIAVSDTVYSTDIYRNPESYFNSKFNDKFKKI